MTSALVFDFDKPDQKLPTQCVHELKKLGIPGYVERSKSKGYHVWVFFPCTGVLACKARCIAKWVLDRMDCSETEVFPKQDRLEHHGQYGNFINLPLFGMFARQGRMVFVDESFVPYPDQWAFLESIQSVSAKHLDECFEKIQGGTSVRAHRRNSTVILPIRRQSGSLLPCAVRMLAEGVQWNQRVACFRLAFHLRRSGLSFGSAVCQLRQWAARNRPSMGKGILRESEIINQTRAAYSRSYTSLGCEESIMQVFCDAKCPVRRSRK